jgi:PIN domain nuclease of toxin-antitoxin system
LLDTSALIWISQAAPIDLAARTALDELWISGRSPWVSPISAWEVGTLVSKGRLTLTMSPEKWWSSTMERVGLELAPMPPPILIASTQLPGLPPNDPADRIIAATAREHGLRLMTRDNKLLAYADAGHLVALPC